MAKPVLAVLDIGEHRLEFDDVQVNPKLHRDGSFKRRSRVVGIFPNEASAIRLVGAILAGLHDEWQASDRRYLTEDSMSLLYPQRDSLTTAELTAGN